MNAPLCIATGRSKRSQGQDPAVVAIVHALLAVEARIDELTDHLARR